MKKKLKLSPQDMLIAYLAVNRIPDTEIAKQVGVCSKTVQRRLLNPTIIAYQDKLREANHVALVSESTKKLEKIGEKFSYAEVVDGYIEIYRLPNTTRNAFARLKSLERLEVIFKPTGPLEAGEAQDSEQPDKPDVYVAEWLRRPQ